MEIRWISIFLSILLVVLLVLVTPIILANRGMLSISEFISLLSIVFSWPTAALIISLTFFARFYDAIESLLKNVGSMKFPGGFEIQRQDQNPPVKEADIKSKHLLAPPNQDKLNEIGEALSEIQKDKKISENDIQLLIKQHSELVNAVKFWKFSYLSQFFVQQTKNVLLWFSRSAPQTRRPLKNPLPEKWLWINVPLCH